MNKLLVLILSLLIISSCTATKIVDVKSPCVSTKDGPCGPRMPINGWWIGKAQS